MNESTSKRLRGVIQLDAVRNSDGLVTVTPTDQDRYNLRVDEAIEGCRVAHEDKRARDRFELLLRRLGDWVLGRSDVHGAWVTEHELGFAFVVVQESCEHSVSFEDDLAELDLEIARDTDIRLPVEIISLPRVPDSSVHSFLSNNFALRFQGANSPNQDEQS